MNLVYLLSDWRVRYENGEDVRAIARDLGVSLIALRMKAWRLGLTRPGKRWGSLERALAHTVETPDGCLLSKSFTLPNGYTRSDSNAYAHRTVYEMAVGPIPKGTTIDHVCHNRSCINPEHLRLLSAGDNARHRKPGAFRDECLLRLSLGLHVHPRNIAKYVNRDPGDEESAA